MLQVRDEGGKGNGVVLRVTWGEEGVFQVRERRDAARKRGKGMLQVRGRGRAVFAVSVLVHSSFKAA